jgi:antirestriction protein ArdC
MDTYAIVTEKIISLLEQGIVPWLTGDLGLQPECHATLYRKSRTGV